MATTPDAAALGAWDPVRDAYFVHDKLGRGTDGVVVRGVVRAGPHARAWHALKHTRAADQDRCQVANHYHNKHSAITYHYIEIAVLCRILPPCSGFTTPT